MIPFNVVNYVASEGAKQVGKVVLSEGSKKLVKAAAVAVTGAVVYRIV